MYNGLWFTQHRRDLDAYVESTQRAVEGTVRVRLHKGTCTVVGRKSPNSLYNYGLATYDRADAFDHKSAEGFIAIYGLLCATRPRCGGRPPGPTEYNRTRAICNYASGVKYL